MKQNIKGMLKRVIKEEVRKVKRLNEQQDLSFEGIANWIRTNIEDAENFSDDQVGVILLAASRGMTVRGPERIARAQAMRSSASAAIQQARDETDEDKAWGEFDDAYPAWGIKPQPKSGTLYGRQDVEDLADRVSQALFR